jgi:polyphosphate kinase 2 (PPK2 family)
MLETVNPDVSMSKEEYIQELIPLQVALHSLGYQVYVQQRPVVMVYEGWDASGKGGNIKRVTEKLDPRGYTVHAIAAPDGEDKTHQYLWRFWRRLPEKGQIAIFDRSWYGRVMVERIEGFCTEEEWRRAYREINHFERQLSDFGAILFKFWIHISKEEQLRRFEERKDTAYKSWKLTDEDWRNRDRWDIYEEAVNEMLLKTSTLTAPWTIVEGNCKWHARVKVLRTLVDGLSAALDYDPTEMMDIARESGKKKKKKKGKKKKIKVTDKSLELEASALPTIDSFEFERVVILGEEYKSDVLISPDGNISKWDREEEHTIKLVDIEGVLSQKPDLIVIGTGTIGNLNLAEDVEPFLGEKNIEVIAYKSEKAIDVYRQLRNQHRVLLLLHVGD